MFCVECDAAASVYCEADSAFLCAPCDVKVHSANRLALRHVRVHLHEIDDAVDALLVPDLQPKFPVSEEALQWEAVVPDAADLASTADACVKREAEELAASSGAFLHLFSKRFMSSESSSVSDITVRADSELNALSENNSSHTPERTEEERRRDRIAALERFRNKRANRSFAKKVRYECRKQLADRRPRVKGRFVKKCEMALYLKYGANYRLYLHEIAESVEVKPSLSGKADRTKTEIDEFLSKSAGNVQAPFSSPSSIMTEP